MKATILVRDLVKLIAKHGDLDVTVHISTGNNGHVDSDISCVDETTGPFDYIVGFELYGEEK